MASIAQHRASECSSARARATVTRLRKFLVISGPGVALREPWRPGERCETLCSRPREPTVGPQVASPMEDEAFRAAVEKQKTQMRGTPEEDLNRKRGNLERTLEGKSGGPVNDGGLKLKV